MVLVDSWYLQRKTKCTLESSAVMDDGTTPPKIFFVLALMSSGETTAL